MGIKTVLQPPYSQDLAHCDFGLFPQLRVCHYETSEEMKGCDEGHWHAHTRGLSWGLPEVVGTVQQVHCSRRRSLLRWLEFYVYTIIKSAHTKRVWKLIVSAPCIWRLYAIKPTKPNQTSLDMYIYIYIYIYIYNCKKNCHLAIIDSFPLDTPPEKPSSSDSYQKMERNKYKYILSMDS